MRPFHRIVPFVTMLGAAGCASGAEVDIQSDTARSPRPPSTAATEPDPTPSSDRPPSEPDPSARPSATADLVALARSSNAFGFDLYARARTSPGNLAISPASLTIALTMAATGARGETASELARVLHLSEVSPATARAAGRLSALLQDPARPGTLRIANRLFGEKTFAFEQPYLDLTREAFRAPLEPVDYVNASASARAHINAWVEEQTERRIKDLIPPDGVNEDTRLVLVNAIYFLADWAAAFDPANTRPEPFHTIANASKPVPTMSREAVLRTAHVDRLRLVELPYAGDTTSMTILLPDQVDGIDALEKSLTIDRLDRWSAALAPTEVHVTLPKFEIDPPSSLSLASTLAAMGVTRAFHAGQADFTGIANPADQARRLYFSAVFHKAFVKIDEKGTEAAAATAIAMTEGAAEPPKPVEVRVDHPFLFLIRERSTGLVLFTGRVMDPQVK